MLGLILIYWIGKSFYKLAEQYGKSEWGYAILGVIVFYAGQILLGILALAFMGFEEALDGSADMALNLFGIVVGGLVCWGFYTFLSNRWKNAPAKTTYDPINDDILDSEFLEP